MERWPGCKPWKLFIIQIEQKMQEIQDQKEVNEERFCEIDRRWSRVEQAFRVEDKEREAQVEDLQSQLRQHKQIASTLESRKIQIIRRKLQDLEGAATDLKENLGGLIEDEVGFRVDHLDQKNNFIHAYTQGANGFHKSLQQYSTNRINDLAKKLELANETKLQKTQAALSELKQGVIGESRQMFAKEKEKQTQLLSKLAEDSNKEFDGIRALVRASRKQKQDNEAKLKLMIQGLVEQLGRAHEEEEREGEATYDSLLKTLEECCDRIQQAQLR